MYNSYDDLEDEHANYESDSGHYMHKDLDHKYDGEYMRYEDRDEEIMRHHAHFKEVENPHEDVDYSPTSHEDQHRHHFPSEDRYYPGEVPGSYETVHEYLPELNEAEKNET